MLEDFRVFRIPTKWTSTPNTQAQVHEQKTARTLSSVPVGFLRCLVKQ